MRATPGSEKLSITPEQKAKALALFDKTNAEPSSQLFKDAELLEQIIPGLRLRSAVLQKIGTYAESDIEVEIQKLSQYYVPTRYPDAALGSLPDGMPNSSDAGNAKD